MTNSTIEDEPATGRSSLNGQPAALPIELLTDASRTDELLERTDAHGIERPTMLLVAELARGPDLGPQAVPLGRDEFVAAALSAVTADAMPPDAARRWLFWLWNQAPESISSRIEEASALRAAEQVIEMHREADRGASLTAAQWRSARRRLAAVEVPDRSTLAIDAIAASMWDPETTPGAIADVAALWIEGTALAEAIEQSGWSWADYHAFNTAWDVFASQADKVERLSDETDESFIERRAKFAQDNPPDITPETFEKSAAMYKLRSKLAVEYTERLRAGLLEIALRAD